MPSCRICKNDLPMLFFKLKNGLPLKGCKECNEKARLQRIKNLCPHKRQKSQCKDCNGSSICLHKIIKSNCVKCGGSQICSHKRVISTCKECNGNSVCKHGRQKSQCKDCGGGSVCIHNKLRTRCKDCGGGSYCSHNKFRGLCIHCDGSQLCIHGVERRRCIPCDGSEVCIHKRVKSRCRDCGGNQICTHSILRNSCNICDPKNALKLKVSNAIRRHLRCKKSKKTIEYLGCNIGEYIKYLEQQFDDKMTWDNYGEWEIDHIVPVKYNNPDLDTIKQRLHYTNTQPMWKSENMAKGNNYILGVIYKTDIFSEFIDC